MVKHLDFPTSEETGTHPVPVTAFDVMPSKTLPRTPLAGSEYRSVPSPMGKAWTLAID